MLYLLQTGNENAHTVCNWDAEQEQLAPKVDRRQRMVKRASLMVTQYVQEQKQLKQSTSWTPEKTAMPSSKWARA